MKSSTINTADNARERYDDLFGELEDVLANHGRGY